MLGAAVDDLRLGCDERAAPLVWSRINTVLPLKPGYGGAPDLYLGLETKLTIDGPRRTVRYTQQKYRKLLTQRFMADTQLHALRKVATPQYNEPKAPHLLEKGIYSDIACLLYTSPSPRDS